MTDTDERGGVQWSAEALWEMVRCGIDLAAEA